MRQHQFPPEFETLAPAQIDQLHAWLDDHPYRVVHQKLEAEFGVKISENKLRRYSQHRDLADDLANDEDLNLGVRELYDLMNGAPVPYSEATLMLLSKRAFENALHPTTSVSKLLALQRLVTYKDNLEIRQRRLAVVEQTTAIKAARAGLSTPPPNTPPATPLSPGDAENDSPAPATSHPSVTAPPPSAKPPRTSPLPADSPSEPRQPAPVQIAKPPRESAGRHQKVDTQKEADHRPQRQDAGLLQQHLHAHLEPEQEHQLHARKQPLSVPLVASK